MDVLDLATLSDEVLSRRLVYAEQRGDDDTALEAVNEIAGRLNLPLDHTEQGLTPWASEQIDKYVSEHV